MKRVGSKTDWLNPGQTMVMDRVEEEGKACCYQFHESMGDVISYKSVFVMLLLI